MTFLRFLPLLCALMPATTQAQAVAYQFFGDDTDDFFGHAVRGAGDVDADGVPDLIVGALERPADPKAAERARSTQPRTFDEFVQALERDPIAVLFVREQILSQCRHLI